MHFKSGEDLWDSVAKYVCHRSAEECCSKHMEITAPRFHPKVGAHISFYPPSLFSLLSHFPLISSYSSSYLLFQKFRGRSTTSNRRRLAKRNEREDDDDSKDEENSDDDDDDGDDDQPILLKAKKGTVARRREVRKILSRKNKVC